MPTTQLLAWETENNTLVAHRGNDTRYRIVYSHGYHCLRYEIDGAEFKWMGQFPTIAQAKLTAQEHDDGLRRLKAWERYMTRHDPPPDPPGGTGTGWNP